MDSVLLLLLVVAILIALFVAMMNRAPSTFLFDLIDALFSHDHQPTRR